MTQKNFLDYTPTKDVNEILDYLIKIEKELSKLDRFDAFRVNIENIIKDFTDLNKRLKEILKENKHLIISVVGVVKAGKSSFINSLLFEGEDVLPKALTPMTAALTILEYNDSNEAYIEFYTEKEWDFLKREIVKISNPKEIEIVELLEKDNSMMKLLNSKKKLKGKDYKEILKKVSDFISSNNNISYLVKEVYLKINHDKLKDIKLVDTPGLNDPIISRGFKTKEYLSRSHVIFHLSKAAQFLEKEDQVLLSRYSSEAIKNLYIFASRYDELLPQVLKLSTKKKKINLLKKLKRSDKQNSKHTHIEKLIPVIRRKLEERFQNVLNFIEQQEYYENMNFSLISSLFYKAYLDKLSESEKEYIHQLENIGILLGEKENWINYSGIEYCHKIICDAKEKKERIIKEKQNEIRLQKRKSVCNTISKTFQHIDNITLVDYSEIKFYERFLLKIDSLNKKVNYTLKRYLTHKLKKFNVIINHSLEHLKKNKRSLKIHIRKDTESFSYSYTTTTSYIEEGLICDEVRTVKREISEVKSIEFDAIDTEKTIEFIESLLKIPIKNYKKTLEEEGISVSIIKEELRAKIEKVIEAELESYFDNLKETLNSDINQNVPSFEDIKNKLIFYIGEKINNLQIKRFDNVYLDREKLRKLLEDIYIDLTKELQIKIQNNKGEVSQKEINTISSKYISKGNKLIKELMIPLLDDLENKVLIAKKDFNESIEKTKEDIHDILKISLQDLIKDIKFIKEHKEETSNILNNLKLALENIRALNCQNSNFS